MPRHEVVIIPKMMDGGSPVEMSKNPPATEPTPQQKGETPGKKDVVGAFIVHTSKKIAVGVVDRIGSATGNYVINDQIRNVTNLAAYAGYIAVNPIVGGIYVGIDMGMKVFDYSLRMDKANKETQLYREQMGIATSKGSRLGGRKV